MRTRSGMTQSCPASQPPASTSVPKHRQMPAEHEHWKTGDSGCPQLSSMVPPHALPSEVHAVPATTAAGAGHVEASTSDAASQVPGDPSGIEAMHSQMPAEHEQGTVAPPQLSGTKPLHLVPSGKVQAPNPPSAPFHEIAEGAGHVGAGFDPHAPVMEAIGATADRTTSSGATDPILHFMPAREQGACRRDFRQNCVPRVSPCARSSLVRNSIPIGGPSNPLRG